MVSYFIQAQAVWYYISMRQFPDMQEYDDRAYIGNYDIQELEAIHEDFREYLTDLSESDLNALELKLKLEENLRRSFLSSIQLELESRE